MDKELKLKGSTRLEKRVAKWANNRAVDYGDGVKGVIDDLMYGGCQSGMVGELICYHDTLRFFRLYRDEINALLVEMLSETGYKSPADLFGDKWDTEDPLANDVQNRNLLSCFAFEETARKLALEAGIDA